MITRRKFIMLSGASAGSILLSGCSAHNLPLKIDEFDDYDFKRFPALGLTTSISQEYNFEAKVEGKIPSELGGTLYRNGPGLFQRAGVRKRCILDGDGMVQAFKIFDGRVNFQNKFVRTEKYLEESAAGKFIYATWSTQAPGGMMANFLGGKVKSQAGVTAVVRNEKLYAFDEFQLPYRLDPNTLETKGTARLGMLEQSKFLSAHSKIDRQTGEWLFFGLEFGPNLTLHIIILDKNNRLNRHQRLKLPHNVYVHDFFVSDRHIIINLPPVELKIIDYILGRTSILGSMSWKPEKGNLILVFDRGTNAAPIQLEAGASWMWHSLNAYEKGDEIIADFVGYQNPDHIIGNDPALIAIMSGRQGQYNYAGEIRRYIINPNRKKIRHEVLDKGSYEFPFINPHHQCHKYRFGYFTKKQKKAIFFTEIARIDMENLSSQSYDFGRGKFCSEPVFVQMPGYRYSPRTGKEPGWLLTEVYDSEKQKTLLAIFRADRISDGPLARVYLNQTIPLGFHGYWHPHND
jgi:all-trans-8'-apo-beta-carotenal 15,15'-oxygenase